MAAHFVEGGYLEEGEIEVCVAKLRGEDQNPTGIVEIQSEAVHAPRVYKVLRDGRVLIVKGDVTYDVWGHIVTR